MKDLRETQKFYPGYRAIAAVLFAATVSIAPAQSGGNFAIDWNSADSGGGIVQTGIYRLAGTIGQPEGGSSSGGVFRLNHGFLQAADLFPVPVTLSRFTLE